MTPFAVLADRAVGWRQGLVSELRPVPRGLADVAVPGWAAVAEPFQPGGTAGGAADDAASARLAAVAEAVERRAAARCRIEAAAPPAAASRWDLGEFCLHSAAQRANPEFPYGSGYRDQPYAPMWTLPDNEEVWVPAGLVGLQRTFGLPVTSSGLAAAADPVSAILRAVQELVERDALTVAWLHGIGPRRVPVPADLTAPVAELGGEVAAFDLTPAYSPHAVIAVAGTLGLAGRARATLGLACRADPGEALRKAWHEWTQGTVFLRVWLSGNAGTTLAPHEVTDFDAHAAYYTANPASWDELPWWRGTGYSCPVPSPATGQGVAAELLELVHALRDGGVRLAYRELTTPEAAAVGLRVVRALSPELVPLHADHRWPHLGGTAVDLHHRYPEAVPAVPFPSPYPHPLG